MKGTRDRVINCFIIRVLSAIWGLTRLVVTELGIVAERPFIWDLYRVLTRETVVHRHEVLSFVASLGSLPIESVSGQLHAVVFFLLNRISIMFCLTFLSQFWRFVSDSANHFIKVITLTLTTTHDNICLKT
jgi:hypothetical protein